jgi:predicted RNA-binding Zn-ribbon protein involved in translation (DUF1610 family)
MTVLSAFSNRTVGLAMIRTTHTCRKCGSADIVKNGHSASGSQQHHCKDCGPTHEPVEKGSGELSHVERFFGLIRQRLSRYARETRSASQTKMTAPDRRAGGSLGAAVCRPSCSEQSDNAL